MAARAAGRATRVRLGRHGTTHLGGLGVWDRPPRREPGPPGGRRISGVITAVLGWHALSVQVGVEAFFVVLFVTIFAVVLRSQRGASGRPTDVVRYLKKPGAKHTVRHRGAFLSSQGLWNPAKSWRAADRLYGPGEGTYWLDANGQVNLDWRPRNGEPQHFVGAVPAGVDRHSPSRRRARRILQVIAAIYLAGALTGFLLGYALSSGTSGHRAAIGAFGAVGGYFVVYFVASVVIGVVRVRQGNKSAR